MLLLLLDPSKTFFLQKQKWDLHPQKLVDCKNEEEKKVFLPPPPALKNLGLPAKKIRTANKKKKRKKIGIHATIRIGQEIQFLPYAGITGNIF